MHLAFQTPSCALPCRPWVHSGCRQHAPGRFDHVVGAAGSQSKVAETSAGSDGRVENLSTSYCDNFQCTSSPAVGNTIKSFAKDIERGKSWTLSLFAERVCYKGGARSFTGKSKYQRLYWARDNLAEYKTKVISMEMVGKDTADVKWKFSGQLGPLPLKGAVTSTLVLNPLTGQILQHTDRYSFAESDPVVYSACVDPRSYTPGTIIACNLGENACGVGAASVSPLARHQ